MAGLHLASGGGVEAGHNIGPIYGRLGWLTLPSATDEDLGASLDFEDRSLARPVLLAVDGRDFTKPLIPWNLDEIGFVSHFGAMGSPAADTDCPPRART